MRLEIIQGQEKEKGPIEINDTFSIGRSPENDLVLSDPTVSGKHATITVSGNGALLKDTSKNGTKVNGIFIEEYQLKDKDEIGMGLAKLLFMLTDNDRGEENGTSVFQTSDDSTDESSVNQAPKRDGERVSRSVKNAALKNKKEPIPPVRLALYGIIFIGLLVFLFISKQEGDDEDPKDHKLLSSAKSIEKVDPQETITVMGDRSPLDSLKKAQALFELAENLYQDKTKAQNMYRAVTKWSKAFAILNKYREKPFVFTKHKALYEEAKQALDEMYSSITAQVKVLSKQKNYQGAVALLSQLTDVIPDQTDPRHRTAVRQKALYSQYLR